MTESLREEVRKQVRFWIESISDPSVRGELERHLTRFDNPLQIAVCGPFSAGKSTFLNALLGREVLPTGNLPTTKCLTRLRFAYRPSASIIYEDGSISNLTLDHLKECDSYDGESGAQHYAAEIAEIKVRYRANVLREAIILDTPGLNAPGGTDTAIAEKALAKADVLFWVENILGAVLDRNSVDMLERYRYRFQGSSVCIMSRIDLQPNWKDYKPVLSNHLEQTVPRYFSHLLFVSPRNALRRAEGTGEWPEFVIWFRQRILPDKDNIVARGIRRDVERYLNQQVVASARQGNTTLLTELLDVALRPDGTDHDGEIPLLAAVDAGRYETVKLLLDRGANSGIVDKEGKTLLMKASERGDIRTVGELLERGTALEEVNDQGRTALMLACMKGRKDVVRILLQKGANPDTKDGHNNSSVELAAGCGDPEVYRIIRSKCEKCKEKRPAERSWLPQFSQLCEECYAEVKLDHCCECKKHPATHEDGGKRYCETHWQNHLTRRRFAPVSDPCSTCGVRPANHFMNNQRLCFKCYDKLAKKEPPKHRPRVDSSGGCCIVTVLFAAAAFPTIDTYRLFRDTVLQKSPFGRMIISLYWTLSPSTCALIRRFSFLRHPLAQMFKIGEGLLQRFGVTGTKTG